MGVLGFPTGDESSCASVVLRGRDGEVTVIMAKSAIDSERVVMGTSQYDAIAIYEPIDQPTG